MTKTEKAEALANLRSHRHSTLRQIVALSYLVSYAII